MESLAGRVILLWGWRRALTAFLAGAVAALAQPPFDFFAACFVSFPILVWLLDGAVGSSGRGLAARFLPAFSTGWWWGFGYFVAGLWWTGAALLIEAGAFAWALPLAVLGLPALLALFHGLATLVARVFWDDGVGRIAALAFGFGLAEWLRATVLTGFPWNAVGYAAMPLPVLMQSVHVTGLFGMNAFAVFVFAAPAMLGSGRHKRLGLALAVVLAALHVGYGFARLHFAQPPDSTLAVRIVQPSIEQARKWDRRAQDRIFATYLELTRAPSGSDRPAPELIVWPETAVPFLFPDRPEALPALAEAIDEGQMLLAGAVRTERTSARRSDARYYNAIVAIDDTGTLVDAADKVHLVPFGEYVPGGDVLRGLGFQEIVETVGPFSAGSSRRILSVGDGAKALPLICYEVIFPSLVLRDAAEADFIVNVTNDAWYGNTPGPYQHFRQAQVRAVEAGLPMVRAANNGISAIVDAYGRIVDAFAIDAYGVLDAEVPVGRVETLRLGGPLFNGLIIVAAFGGLALAARVLAAATAN